MHQADIQHSDKRLQEKLEQIFQLRRTRSKINWDRSLYFSLLESFGNPHNNLPPVIHVAGTNGKGSVIAMLRSILEAAGKRVHCYTSPHLMKVNERIYLAGKPIEDEYLEGLIDKALEYIDNAPLSFFEITTAIAFKAFSKISADILLLEVGMGGRLDCTNVVENPIATVINRISMDHTDFLGADIVDIAGEKAGIMKGNVPCIIGYQGEGKQSKTIMSVLQQNAQQKKSTPLCYGVDWEIRREDQEIVFSCDGESSHFLQPALIGEHQIMNAGVVLATLKVIRDKVQISDHAIEQGFKSVSWPGRLQQLDDLWPYDTGDHEIWLDSGHNDSAAEALAKQMDVWGESEDKPVHLIVGMLKTKDSSSYLKPLLAQIDNLYIVPIASDPNSHNKVSMTSNIQLIGNYKINDYGSVFETVQYIIKKHINVRIIITGSIYLSGEVLSFVQRRE